MKFSDLRRKEVVNVQDGRSLGCVSDLIIDQAEGKIISMVMPGPFRLAAIFGPEQGVLVSWSNIVKLGEDVILVKMEPPAVPNNR
ncbi:MAG: YlmC/YmxH family sporulation protein [Eubacteriales bacterium]